ncbi:MAG: type II toxin-antitoxin system RelE/ParE family toxin [Acidobacteria bacterium]|nr:type II toxin-antitoxin system RelE/ParE family toxin [Acidobacteriota bacterium]
MAESKPYRVHPEAWLEIGAAADWYEQRSADASVGFIAAVFDGLESIAQAPQRWPKYLYGTRRFVLHRFPFSAVYLDTSDVVNIVAVAHNKRRPGYWKRRV